MTTIPPLPATTLTIQVVSYQTATEVQRLVESLRAQPPQMPWHLVLIDNGSPDRSGDTLAAAYAGAPDITVVLTGENLGFGQAHSRLAAAAHSEYLCFLNPDCVIDADACTGLVDYLAAHPEIGIVGPLFFNPDGTPQAWVRSFPDPWSGLAGRQSFLRKVWPTNPLSRRYLIDNPTAGPAQRCDWVVGTILVVRREEFLTVGGFDPRFFLYWEDCDLCWEYLKQLQLGCAFVQTGHITHFAEAAATKVRPFAIRQFNRNAYKLMCKHLFPFPLHPWRIFAYCALSLRTWVLLAKAHRGA